MNYTSFAAAFEHRGEVVDVRADDDRLLDDVGDGVLRLQAVAGDADDDLLVARNAALLDQLLRDGQGDAAGGLGEDAFGLGEQQHRLGDFLVVDVLAPAAGFAHDLDGEVAVGRIADGQRLGDGVRLAHGAMRIQARLEARGDRVAAGRLGAVDLALRLLVEQADLVEFVEGLVDLADQAAAGHRRDDVLRRAPAELLGDFVAERLGAFRVEGPQVDVDEAPVVAVGDLAAQAVDVVIGSLDGDQLRARRRWCR